MQIGPHVVDPEGVPKTLILALSEDMTSVALFKVNIPGYENVVLTHEQVRACAS